MAFLILHRQMAAVTLGDDVVRSQSCSTYHENALPGTTQVGSPRSRLKTEVLELRERSIFADVADARARSSIILTAAFTYASISALIVRRRILLINSFFCLLLKTVQGNRAPHINIKFIKYSYKMLYCSH